MQANPRQHQGLPINAVPVALNQADDQVHAGPGSPLPLQPFPQHVPPPRIRDADIDFVWRAMFPLTPRRRQHEALGRLLFTACGAIIASATALACLVASRAMPVNCLRSMAVANLILAFPLDAIDEVDYYYHTMPRLVWMFVGALGLWVLTSPLSLALMGASATGWTLIITGMRYPQDTRYNTELRLGLALLAAAIGEFMQLCFLLVTISSTGRMRYIWATSGGAALLAIAEATRIEMTVLQAMDALNAYVLERAAAVSRRFSENSSAAVAA